MLHARTRFASGNIFALLGVRVFQLGDARISSARESATSFLLLETARL